MSADTHAAAPAEAAAPNVGSTADAARDFQLYATLSHELLKFIGQEDIDEFLSLAEQRQRVVERMQKNPAVGDYRKTTECQRLIDECHPLDMQIIYKARAWLNKSRRKNAAVHAYDLKTLNPVGNIFNKKY